MRRLILAVPFVLLAAFIASTLAFAQNHDFAHNESPAQTVYSSQAAVYTQLSNQVESILYSSQPILSCGSSSTGNDVADSEWGTIALLTFWWYQNNGSTTGFSSVQQSGHHAMNATVYQTFAQTELSYALGTNASGTQYPCDLSDTSITGLETQANGYSSAYLLKASGYDFAKYTYNDPQGSPAAISDADYEETALTLIYKDIIQQYNTTPGGAALFTTSQISAISTSAQSNWNWITQDAEYNPEHTANQAMMAVNGGYWLGLVSNSPSTMSAALNFYDGGPVSSNNSAGYRQQEIATNPQGYKYFTEHYRCIEPTTPPTVLFDPNSSGTCVYSGSQITPQLDGFDTHYSGLQLTHMVQLINLMSQGQTKYPNGCSTNNGTSCIGPNVYADALAEAQYSRDRLSQGGTMHGGSRHNEIGATATDITFGAGYNYFGSSSQLNSDMGRALVTVDSSNGSGNANAWGHRSSETIFLYLNWNNWVTSSQSAPVISNDLATLRRNNVSVNFDYGNQPQEIAVAGTVLTDALRGSVAGSTSSPNTAAEEDGTNGKAQGLQLTDTSSNIYSNAVMAAPTYDSTTHFNIHSTTGTASTPDGSANVREYYVTDGEALYIINLVQFTSASSALSSVSSLLGVPYISAEDRLVNVSPVSGLSSCYGSYSILDLSSNAGYCFGTASSSVPTGLATGDVDLYAWPQLYAEAEDKASPTGNIWMSTADVLEGSTETPIYELTLDGLSDASPPIYYYPNSSSAVINYTGDIRSVMQPTSGSTTYASGDFIASVVRVTPSSFTNTMRVTASYKSGSTYNLSGCTTSPCLDVEDSISNSSDTSSMSFKVSSTGVVTFTDNGSSQTITSPELLNQTVSATTIATQTFGVAPIPLSSFSASATSGLAVTFTVTSGPASVSGSNLDITGAGTVVLQVSQPGNSTYQAATPVSLSFLVNPETPTITWTNPSAITYGTALSGTQLNATASTAGTFSYSPAAGTVLATGAHTLGVTFTPTDTTDYTTNTANVSLTVNKATLTVTANAASITYGSSAPTYSDTITGFVNGDTISVVSGTASLTASPGTPPQAGSYTITAALGSLAATNYTFTFVNGTLTVNKAVLTVTAGSPSMTYGGTVPTYTDTITGYVNGDTGSVVSGAASLTASPGSPAQAGSYTITAAAGSLAATNYTFSFVNGTLTVNTAPLTISANSATIDYGAATPTCVPTISGLVNGDTFSETCSFSPTITGVAAVGSYRMEPHIGAHPNYTLTSGHGTLTVNQATVTVAGTTTTVTHGTTGSVPVTVTGQYAGTGITSPSGTVSYTIVNSGGTTVASGSPSLTTGSTDSTGSVPVPNTLAVGSYTVNVSYNGDTNYLTAPAVHVSLTIN